MMEDKILLITGGTGSFGNAVLEKYVHTEIAEIRIFSRDEKKQDDMRKKYQDPKIKFYLGDTREYASLSNVMHGVDYIFHAAALKQVPSCEFFPMEAIKTNVLGTENVLSAAIAHGVRKVICLSTDKAAYPVNAMGISKAMMEKVYIARSKTVDPQKTILCGTRYGNVMASRGSVIPLFIEQIKQGRALTVTKGDMTRFIMSLSEAVELVQFAFEQGQAGDLLVQKSPACTITDLATALQNLFETDLPIHEIGIRHGEKMHETLLTKEEMAGAEDCGAYYRVPCDQRDLNYNRYFVEGNDLLRTASEYNSSNTRQLDVPQIMDKLLSLDYIKAEVAAWKGRS